MANRVIRDYTNSEKVNKLSPGAENFFSRLIMKADDFGSFYANEKLLLANLFPLKVDDYTPEMVSNWRDECINAELLISYSVDGKEFIRILNFGQRLRNMRNKFPDPQQVAASCGDKPPESEEKRSRNRNESETEEEGELIFPYNSENFLKVWNVLVKEKKWLKKSFAALQASLEKLSNYPEEEAIQMMKNAIAGGWQGLFEIDKKNKNGKQRGEKVTDDELAEAIRRSYRQPGSS